MFAKKTAKQTKPMSKRLFDRVASGVCAVGLGAILAQAAAPASPQGVITAKAFLDIGGGTAVTDLTGNAKFPDNPDIVQYPPYFELWATGDIATPPPADVYNNYGSQIVGYFYPPSTGDYVFFIASDDGGNLYLSTDDTPANKKLIAQEAGWSGVRSFTAIGGGSTIEAKDSSQFTGTEWPTKDPFLGGAKITLTQGKAYYIEALHKEGSGGDNLAVAVQDPGFLIDSTAPIPGQYLSSFDKNSGPVTIKTQPASLTVNEGDPATFSVELDGTPPYTYQWKLNGTDITDATNSVYTLAWAAYADNGAKFSVVVGGAQGTATSGEATLTVNKDVTPPTIVSAAGSPSYTKATLSFSEPVDPATATVLANYSISPALAISAAEVRDLTNVVLTTAKQTPGATAYTVTVNGVKDIPGNTIAANSQVTFYTFVDRQGVLVFDYWGGLSTSDNSIDSTLAADPRYPNNPDWTVNTTAFDSRPVFPDDSHEGYGGRISGVLIPTESGDYDFFLRSDDSSRLFMSTTDDNPANAELIAEQTGCCNAFTEPGVAYTTAIPISLVAGKRYYMEAIYKEGTGGDYCQVAWRKTTDSTPAANLTPIPGKFFSSPVTPDGLFLSTTPTPDTTNAAPNLVQVVHVDGATPWAQDNVTLMVDGAQVTATVTKDGGVATVSYTPGPLFAAQSTHQVTVTYPAAGGNTAKHEWQFTVAPITKDKLHSYVGLVMGNAAFTPDAGGRTGLAGDYAMDFGTTGQRTAVYIYDASWLNAITANDEMSFSFWLKRYDINASSAFWAVSPSSNNGQRGWQAHTPWNNDNIYFDTAGCCDAGTQRINAHINTLPDYLTVGDDTWWTTKWHHFVFSKKADVKQIWIDGVLFLEGSNTAPLPTDFTSLYLGADNTGVGNNMHGMEDDFAVFGTALAESDVQKLASGTAPTDLAASTKLTAYWDFNDGATTTAPTLSISRDGANVRVTWTGTLQAADAITGPWSDVTGSDQPGQHRPGRPGEVLSGQAVSRSEKCFNGSTRGPEQSGPLPLCTPTLFAARLPPCRTTSRRLGQRLRACAPRSIRELGLACSR